MKNKKITKIDSFNSAHLLKMAMDAADEQQKPVLRTFRGDNAKLKPEVAVHVLKILADTGKIENVKKFNHFAKTLGGDVLPSDVPRYDGQVAKLRSEFTKSAFAKGEPLTTETEKAEAEALELLKNWQQRRQPGGYDF